MEKLKENTQEINKKSIEKNINSEEIKTQISIFLYDSWIKSPWERKEIFWILEQKLGEKKILEISSSFPNLKILVEQNSKKEIFVFNVEEKKFVENIEENVSELPKKFEETQKIFDAMDEIFKQNKKEVFGELNKEDILKTDNFENCEIPLVLRYKVKGNSFLSFTKSPLKERFPIGGKVAVYYDPKKPKHSYVERPLRPGRYAWLVKCFIYLNVFIMVALAFFIMFILPNLMK